MSIQARSVRGRAVTSALVLAAAMAAAGGTSVSASATTGSGVVHRVGAAAQSATRAYWTASRMAAAAGRVEHMSAGTAEAPATAPQSTHFDGVKTVGALFDTTGNQAHFCTASVVNSQAGDIIITAAHCVYGKSYATNIEFVPGYYRGNSPYGAWPVSSITVATQWMKSNAQNYDFAFLTVTPPTGTTQPIQEVTGGLWLGINTGYAHPIEAIGYNDTADMPIKCATNSFKYSTHQMKFFCRGFWNGTSGGPWIVNYNGHTGSGTIIGDIGGFEQGGNYEWASYSVYYEWPTFQLFLQAQGYSQAS